MEVKFVSKEAHDSFINNNTQFKLIILIIASRGETYDMFIKCWKAYMSLYPDVKAFFLFSDPDLPCDVLITEDSIINKHPECNIPGILIKTIEAMNLCNEAFKYSYLLRTNLSSFYNIPRLLKYLDSQSRTNYVGSQFYILPNVPQKQEEIQFVNNYLEKKLDDKFVFLHGAGFILSNDVVENYCDQILRNEPKVARTRGVADDIAISIVLYNFLSPATFSENGFYFPPEFRSLHEHKYQCRKLIHPNEYDNEKIFHVRNKKDDSISDNSIEARRDEVLNYVMQVRYYYNMPNFMSEIGPIIMTKHDLKNDFVLFDHDKEYDPLYLNAIPGETDENIEGEDSENIEEKKDDTDNQLSDEIVDLNTSLTLSEDIVFDESPQLFA